MTEHVVLDAADTGELFAGHDPAPVESVDLSVAGAAALREADASLGLALSDQEVEYLVDAYGRLGRDPRDVELMMFAQANSEH